MPKPVDATTITRAALNDLNLTAGGVTLGTGRVPSTATATSPQVNVPSDAVVEMISASRTDRPRLRFDRPGDVRDAALVMFCAVGSIAPLAIAAVGGGPEDVAAAFFSSILAALLFLADRGR